MPAKKRKPMIKKNLKKPNKKVQSVKKKVVKPKAPIKKTQKLKPKKVVSKVKKVSKVSKQSKVKPKLKPVKQVVPVSKKSPLVKADKKSFNQTTQKPSGNKKVTSTNTGATPHLEKENEDYMMGKEQEHFKEKLNAWKRELMEEVDRTVHHMQDEAGNFADPNDRASQEEVFNLELRARDRERKLIKKIEEALQKIENNDYGYCDVCGAEIGIRRLEARPTAALCIDCKTLDEIKERQWSGGVD